MANELKKYEKLKKQLQNLDLVIPGTIRETYTRCQSEYCRCRESKQYRHGPYYLWDRKVNGKLSSKSLPRELVPLYEKWIEERRQLEELVNELLETGLNYASDVSRVKKSKKI